MSSRFERYLLPRLAFKAVVIGGGYATGRELAEFFLPSGPWGGIAAMLLAMLIWNRLLAWIFLLVYVLPLLTIGVFRLVSSRGVSQGVA